MMMMMQTAMMMVKMAMMFRCSDALVASLLDQGLDDDYDDAGAGNYAHDDADADSDDDGEDGDDD